MFKYFALFFLIGCAMAIPAPEAKAEAKPEAKPGVLAYSSPIVAPAVAYSAYSAPVAYSSYVAPSVYASPYAPYAAYSAPLVVY
ncbi:hypothetical protein HHI36_020411 [Cryptolaemus montrouzieri]|uniref:Neuropeptide-like 4 n=1 Tax=Cryptolaemus montrouzieri TaxID=559131 RepID=A0ABD2NA94_9CUCU